MMTAKYIVRPVTKRLDQKKLLAAVTKLTPVMLRINGILDKIPLIGFALKRLVPVADYRGIFPFTASQHEQISVLDTFDMLSPAYDNPQTRSTVERWYREISFDDIEVFHSAHLVARGRKPHILGK